MRFLSFKPCFGASEVIFTRISDILANKFHLGRLNFNTVASDIVSRIPCELFGKIGFKKKLRNTPALLYFQAAGWYFWIRI